MLGRKSAVGRAAARSVGAPHSCRPFARLVGCARCWLGAESPLSQRADAHGIAGNRYFPGTLTFDDPAVADEAILPNFSSLNHRHGGGLVTDNRINWSFTRLLTPTVGVVVDNSWVARNWGAANRTGFDVTNLGLKCEVYRDNPMRR